MKHEDEPKMTMHTAEIEISQEEAWANLKLLASCVSEVGVLQAHMMNSKYGDLMASMQKRVLHDIVDMTDLKTGKFPMDQVGKIATQIREIDQLYVKLLNDLANGAMIAIQVLPLDQLMEIDATREYDEMPEEDRKTLKEAVGEGFDTNKASLTKPHIDVAKIMSASIRLFGKTQSITEQAIAVQGAPDESEDPRIRLALAVVGPFLKGAVLRGTTKRNTVMALLTPLEGIGGVFKTLGLNFVCDYECGPEEVFSKIHEHHRTMMGLSLAAFDQTEAGEAVPATPPRETSHIFPGTGSLN